jgi:hypothetical protein
VADIDFAVVDAESGARNYWFSDGLDLLLLSVFIALAGCFGLIRPLPLWKSLAILGLISVAGYLLAAKRSPMLGWLKSRITYPRSGYASIELPKLKREDWRRYPEAFVVFFSAAVFDMNPAPWIGLIALAAGLGFLWGRFGFSFLIPGIAMSGVLVAASSRAHGSSMAWLFIALAILYFIKGTRQLLRYLRQHPAPQA